MLETIHINMWTTNIVRYKCDDVGYRTVALCGHDDLPRSSNAVNASMHHDELFSDRDTTTSHAANDSYITMKKSAHG